tara:strand:- start:6024 stop:7196 length:1173 start_codon:yes stop_codon:yes gene_type:complete
MKLIKKFLKHALVIAILGYSIYHLLYTSRVLNPLEKELDDFKFSDIYFGHIQKKVTDQDIFLIDIGSKNNTTTRSEISDFINIVNKKYKPKVIALDVQFMRDSSVSDNVNERLVNSLNADNIIISYDLVNVKDKWFKNSSEIPLNYNIVSEGFVNNLVADGDINFKVERFFQPSIVQGFDTLKHFSVVTAKKYGSKFNKSLIKDDNKVMINFKYQYSDAISIGDTNNYTKLKDKIVIIGLFTKNKKGLPKYNEDVHYTSSNKYYLGKSPPNMYGGEVLATIISNINNNSFVLYYKSLSFWVNIIFSILVYLGLLYFAQKSHNVFAVSTIITQFGLVTLFVFLSLFFIAKFNMYLDLTILGVIAFFSVEFVEPIDKIIAFVESKLKTRRTI